MFFVAPSLPSASSSLFARAALRARANARLVLFSAAMLICCWASGVQPAAAQSGDYALTASPSTVNPGETINVHWTTPGGQHASDWIALYQVGTADTQYISWQYTAGASSGSTTFAAPGQTGEYEFRYFTNNSYTKVATSNPVTVGSGVTPTPTPSPTPTVGFALTASPSTVNPGQNITVNWTTPGGRPANDWIAFYQVGTADTQHISWLYTAGASSGNTTFTAPSQAGQYEFRYFTNNSYNKVATSNPVTVGGGGATPTPTPTPTPSPTPSPTPTPTLGFALTAGPGTVNPGQSVNVTWTAPSGRPANDWIALYQVGTADIQYLSWQYTAGVSSGSTTFTAPGQTGQYEFRYFTNNTYSKVATSNPVTVGAGGSNYPDTSVLLSTDTTVTPDAAPANTSSINVATSTNFKGKLEGDPATGVVRVTNAHPAGTYAVTVTAFDGGGATTTKTFELAVTTPETCAPVSFAAAANFSVGAKPFSVAVGDFNGDGKQDLAVANFNDNNVSILLGDGAGSFSAATNFSVGISPDSVAVGDFNGDGKQDLAVANLGLNLGSNYVSILLGDGAGSFSAATNFRVGIPPLDDQPISVAVGDFNGDGKQDLAVANFGGSNVSILLGDGAGSFSTPTNFGADLGSNSVAVGDFNGDGKQDLAVANNNDGGDGVGGDVSILIGNGAGSFSRPTKFIVGVFPFSVAVGDFNGDGKQDLAVSNLADVSILLGDGAGGFGAATNFSVGAKMFAVVLGDFNGDGKQDLAVRNSSLQAVSILLGDGTGSFGAAINVGAGTNPFSLAVGDFNGDGKQDLVTVNDTSNSVSIFLRDCASTPSPTPTPTPNPTADYALTASPSTVNPGQGITVTWTAPSGRPANDWIALYKVGDPDVGYSAWQYTGGASSGSTIFTAPSQAGQYEFRYFTNNSYTEVATSNPVAVGGSP